MIVDWNDAYQNREYIENSDAFPEKWSKLAADFRENMKLIDRMQNGLRYGSKERNVLDIFLPQGNQKGLLLFVHGGYWRAFDNSYWSHLATGALSRGWAVCMPSYTLVPQVSIAEITQEISQALDYASKIVSGPIVLSGHSAGGHLASRMVCENVSLTEDVKSRIINTVSISGVHDLRPLLNTDMNQDFKLDDAMAKAESPVLCSPRSGTSITCLVGGDERPEFLRQNEIGRAHV